MNPQLHHAQTLISLLHPAPSATTLIEITGLAPHLRQRPRKMYFLDAAVAAQCVEELCTERVNAFVSVNPRSAMSGEKQYVPFISTIALDLQPERTSIQDVVFRLETGHIPPTAIVWSGYGAHMYLRLREPAPVATAELIGDRLCKFTGSDAIWNASRIMRCPGSLNWKRNPPSWCYLTAVDASRAYTLDQIDIALDRLGAGPARPVHEGIPVSENPPTDWLELRRMLSPGVLDIIDTGEKNAYSEKQVTRSEADWVVVCALVSAGAPDEMIEWVYETQPVGLLKYRSSGVRYLRQTIASARRATAEPIQNRLVTRTVAHPRFTGSSADTARGRSAGRMYR